MAKRNQDGKRHEWEQRLARYRTSGMTVSKFCANENVSVPSFYNWTHRLRSGVGQSRVSARGRRTDGTVANAGRDSRTASPTIGAIQLRSASGIEISIPTQSIDVLPSVLRCLQAMTSQSDSFQRVVVSDR